MLEIVQLAVKPFEWDTGALSPLFKAGINGLAAKASNLAVSGVHLPNSSNASSFSDPPPLPSTHHLLAALVFY